MSELITPDTVKEDITLNYERYLAAPQERHPIDHRRAPLRGQLMDPIAQTHEVRMNRGLDQYNDIIKFAGQVTSEFTALEA